MEGEEFETGLRGSPYLRQSLSELLQSVEQALALVAAAAARQLDAERLEADLLDLQSGAAAEMPDPTRDHILNDVRLRLRMLKLTG